MTVRLALMGLEFYSGAEVRIAPDQAHYLCHVMRLKVGQEVHIFNGVQGLWVGRLASVRGDMQIESCLQPQPPDPQQPLHLFFSPIKRQNWLLEKATELGVTHFHPFLCRHTAQRHFSGPRAQKIILEACEQSHRLYIPVLSPLRALAEVLPFEGALFVGQHGSGPLLARLTQQAPTSAQGMLIGPEGGWHPQDWELMYQKQPTLQPVSLGPHILRSETAALVGLAILQNYSIC